LRLFILTLVMLLGGGDCQEFAERSAAVPAAGVTRVVIFGRAGFLHIEGRSGAKEIRATGRACAAIEELLVGIRLSSSRAGSEVTINATVPDQEESFFAASPRLDFTVTLPRGMAVDVVDTTGELTIGDVANVRIAGKKGGAIKVRNVKRNVLIESAGLGDVSVSDVGGDFTLETRGRGSLDYKRVAGRVSLPR
jgi:hypothetical protein